MKNMTTWVAGGTAVALLATVFAVMIIATDDRPVATATRAPVSPGARPSATDPTSATPSSEPSSTASANPSTDDASGPPDAASVDELTDEVVDVLRMVYEVSYLEAERDAADEMRAAVAALPATDQGNANVVLAWTEIAAQAVDSPLIDRVDVSVEGEPRTTALDDGATQVDVDLAVERHVAVDDVDWIEIIPHTLTIDARGDLSGLLVSSGTPGGS